ncbi:MAG TPA: glycosyltransferase family 2 protein [Leptolyngbyaceae cyanobacterium]
MSAPLISAIICTHNRAAYLGAAIDSLLRQSFSDYEILVVDNASTDTTREVVEQRLTHTQLRYLYEPTLGLSVARNRGAAEAQGSILAYLDDDAEASPEWLARLSEVFRQDEQVAIAGGKVTLLWPPGVTAPRWLSPELAGNLGAYDLGSSTQTITQPGLTPRGLNYALRKSFWQQVGGFDPQLGRVGKNLLSNEELLMTQQALKQDFKVLYVPAAVVAHNVAPERLNRGWFLRRSWWQGVSESYREQISGCLTLRQLQMRAICLLRGLYKAARAWHDPAQRFDNLVYAYGQLGYLLNSGQTLFQLRWPSSPEQSSAS